jgi:hypothetical protein
MEEMFFLWQSKHCGINPRGENLDECICCTHAKMHVATCLKEKGKQVSEMHFFEKVLVDCILYVHQSCTFFNNLNDVIKTLHYNHRFHAFIACL